MTATITDSNTLTWMEIQLCPKGGMSLLMTDEKLEDLIKYSQETPFTNFQLCPDHRFCETMYRVLKHIKNPQILWKMYQVLVQQKLIFAVKSEPLPFSSRGDLFTALNYALRKSNLEAAGLFYEKIINPKEESSLENWADIGRFLTFFWPTKLKLEPLYFNEYDQLKAIGELRVPLMQLFEKMDCGETILNIIKSIPFPRRILFAQLLLNPDDPRIIPFLCELSDPSKEIIFDLLTDACNRGTIKEYVEYLSPMSYEDADEIYQIHQLFKKEPYKYYLRRNWTILDEIVNTPSHLRQKVADHVVNKKESNCSQEIVEFVEKWRDKLGRKDLFSQTMAELFAFHQIEHCDDKIYLKVELRELFLQDDIVKLPEQKVEIAKLIFPFLIKHQATPAIWEIRKIVIKFLVSCPIEKRAVAMEKISTKLKYPKGEKDCINVIFEALFLHLSDRLGILYNDFQFREFFLNSSFRPLICKVVPQLLREIKPVNLDVIRQAVLAIKSDDLKTDDEIKDYVQKVAKAHASATKTTIRKP